MHNMLIRPTEEELGDFGTPDFTIYNAGAFPANRYTSYMTSPTSIDVSLEHKEMVILGTQYAGEMKKGVFSLMNYWLPKRGILSLHSGCNVGKDGDVTMFFGLSGTGKTTLSADEKRPLIGDDEHGWGDSGVFNIEGGCYAKAIGLKYENEPEIFDAIKFGTVLENVVFDDDTRLVDYDANTITENTRASYPIEFIDNAHIPCIAGHPKNIIMLCCDAFGVLPPVAKLTKEQAMFVFEVVFDPYRRALACSDSLSSRACQVLFHFRLHGQGGRDGDGRDGAGGHLFGVLRVGIFDVASGKVREHAGREDGCPRRQRVADQHGVDRRGVRDRITV